MIQAKDVEALNSRIEKLNTERTKAETRQEVLLTKLNEEITSYKENYGVNLGGKNFKEIKKKVEAEVTAVSTKVEEEYKLKLQIVQAIDQGDYAEAKRLLGEEVEESAEDELSLNTQEEKTSSKENSEDGEWASFPEALEDVLEEDDEEISLGEEDESVEESTEESIEEPVEESVENEEDAEDTNPQTFLKAVSNVSKIKGKEQQVTKATFEAEDDEEEAPELPKKVKKEVKGNSVKDAMSSLGSASLIVEDDDDDIDDDFGFGDMLSGTKFEDD